MSQELVERYAAGAAVPGRAIAGLTREELLAFPVPGTWSIQQIAVHLMESDLIAGDRIRRIAAMKNPLIMNYDESAFIRELHPELVDAGRACEVFRVHRELLAPVLGALPVEAWSRTGIHSEYGLRTLTQMVKGYCDHLDHHVGFIARKRRLLGKPID